MEQRKRNLEISEQNKGGKSGNDSLEIRLLPEPFINFRNIKGDAITFPGSHKRGKPGKSEIGKSIIRWSRLVGTKLEIRREKG